MKTDRNITDGLILFSYECKDTKIYWLLQNTFVIKTKTESVNAQHWMIHHSQFIIKIQTDL